MKKTSRQSYSSPSMKVVFLAILALVAVWYVYSSKFKSKEPGPQLAIAQLASSGKNSGMGSATKNLNVSNYEIYTTAFLNTPPSGQGYYVWLRDGGNSMSETLLLGKMEKSGDVYSLNYSANENYHSYKEVVVALQKDSDAKAGKLEGEVLVGEFVE